MLRSLYIDNYVLIDHLQIDFSEGMTVITGQTGAGKSIILGALGLLTGARIDSKAVRDQQRKVVVEAIFDHPAGPVTALLADNDIETEEPDRTVILRREILPSGKSRAFVNDTPVKLDLLRNVSTHLLDIHSQHANQMLASPDDQLAILDSYAGNATLLRNYRTTFRSFAACHKELMALKERLSDLRSRSAEVSERLQTLEKLKPKRGELKTLEESLDLLSSAAEVKETLAAVSSIFNGREDAMLTQLAEVAVLLEKLPSALGLAPILKRIEAARIDLKDVAYTLEGVAEEIDVNPKSITLVEERIASLLSLTRQYGLADPDDLEDYHHTLLGSKSDSDSIQSDIHDAEQRLLKLKADLKRDADALSESRRVAARELAYKIEANARLLGLPNLQFAIQVAEQKLTMKGADAVTFLASFNRNQPLTGISGRASGGELSRLMLALKRSVADKMQLPVIVFDEIDTGVSGDMADKMGDMMADIARRIQVIAITHLPQVAAKGRNHLKVYKEEDEQHSSTCLTALSAEQRIEELALMLSGAEINDAARQNARILLNQQSPTDKDYD